jgi:hypothetical protein
MQWQHLADFDRLVLRGDGPLPLAGAASEEAAEHIHIL